MTRILALDPGTDNYGFSLIEAKGRALPRVIRTGMLSRRIKYLTGDQVLKEALLYRKRILKLIAKSKPDHVVIERYVPRTKGLSNESVNYMIGFILCELATTGIKFDLYLAATWKVRLKRFMDLDGFYGRIDRIPDHMIDATFIGMYLAEKFYGFNLESFGKETMLKRVAKMIDTVCQTKDRKPPKRVAKKKVAAKKAPAKKVVARKATAKGKK